MCMSMRTTIEIPSDLRQKLLAEAAAKNLKGYSTLIVHALQLYFSKGDKERINTISQLKGCLNKEEYKEEMKRIKKGRNNWRT